jgi:hypothetical protein
MELGNEKMNVPRGAEHGIRGTPAFPGKKRAKQMSGIAGHAFKVGTKLHSPRPPAGADGDHEEPRMAANRRHGMAILH